MRTNMIGVAVLIAAMAAIGACSASPPAKRDIRGWQTGVAYDDVVKKLDSLACSTRSVPSNEKPTPDFGLNLMADCNSDRFIFEFSPYLESRPVIEVGMMNHTPLSLLDVINSVDSQYQVNLQEVQSIAPNLYREFQADFGAGYRISVLQNHPDGYLPVSEQPGDKSLVLISDMGLITQSRAAEEKSEAEKSEQFRRSNPLPKY